MWLSKLNLFKRNKDKQYKIEYGRIMFVDLPFECSQNEVIYLENKYDEAANRCIRKNIRLIEKCFAKRCLRFVYLPYLGEELSDNKDIWRYRMPYGEIEKHKVPSLKSNYLLDYVAQTPDLRMDMFPCLARHNSTYTVETDKGRIFNVSYFDLFIFDISEARNVKRYFSFLSEQASELNRWSNVKKFNYTLPEHKDADEAFDDEARKLLKEIEYRIDLLRRKGISSVVLENLVKEKPKLSRLTVTKNFKIVLSDYDNLEIKMEPLAKSVFILFLRHPEGIAFKLLSDYRDELADIYGKIKGVNVKRDKTGVRRYDDSIIRLTNPMNNSINEKCARIREAFLLKIQEELAENYFITGKRGEPKGIKLPEDMIVWNV